MVDKMGTVITAITSFFVGLGASVTTAAFLTQITVGVVLNAAIQTLLPKPNFRRGSATPEELRRSLNFPSARPSYRYIYGNYVAIGTPLPYPVVGEFAYACWLINSRPSEGPFTVYLDNREVMLTGDPYDLSGPGATATNDPFLNHVVIWIGRGDQIQCPNTFISEAGYTGGDDTFWRGSDAGKGLTIVWARLRAGLNEERSQRWPNSTPQLALEGNFSKVWDPRDGSQSSTDPNTWQFSDNQALCALDVRMQNPFRPYSESALEISSWILGANVADEVRQLKNGGTEAKYRVAGYATFDGGEIEDIIQPFLIAGASLESQQGAKLGLIPATPLSPSIGISEPMADGALSYSSLRQDDDLPNRVRVSYASSVRAGADAQLPVFDIPGALQEDGGQPRDITYNLGLVPTATQAQQVRKILYSTSRLQKSLSLTCPPDGMRAVPGSVASVELPDPWGPIMNRLYRVEQMHPTADIFGDNALALSIPMVLREYNASIYEWDPATEEQDIFNPVYDSTRSGVPQPGVISITTGNTVNARTGNATIPRVRFAFDPATTAADPAVIPNSTQPNANRSYDWQSRPVGGEYGDTNLIDGGTVLDGNGQVFSFMQGEATVPHDIRVRTNNNGTKSDWVEFIGATPTVDITLAAPINGSATAAFGEITIEFTATNEAEMTAVEIWGSNTNDSGEAALLETINTAQNATVSYTETGLAGGQQRYYFGRSRGNFASASEFTTSVTAIAL